MSKTLISNRTAMDKTIQVRLPSELYSKLLDEQGVSPFRTLSDYVRHVLQRTLERKKR